MWKEEHIPDDWGFGKFNVNHVLQILFYEATQLQHSIANTDCVPSLTCLVCMQIEHQATSKSA